MLFAIEMLAEHIRMNDKVNFSLEGLDDLRKANQMSGAERDPIFLIASGRLVVSDLYQQQAKVWSGGFLWYSSVSNRHSF